MKPYMLNENLERASHQPEFIASEKVISVYDMMSSIKTDNARNARRSAMFQSCGGFRYVRGNRKDICIIYHHNCKIKIYSALILAG